MRRLAPALLAVATVAATAYGWWVFWFLTDDAHISFRYASNWMAGRGLVWNPAPFLPVEGYTSFLWTYGLAVLWWVTGLPPPRTANLVSLACALGTLWTVARLVWRMPWTERQKWPVLCGVLLATVTNRTFLAWTSSGLETALFDLEITAWACAAVDPDLRARAWRLCGWSALAALTRPDGLLLVAGTLLLAPVDRSRWTRRDAASALCYAPVVAHVLWRRWTYGFWLPNTFYAKVVEAWPEAGARYLLAFALEYGLVVPLVAAVVWAVTWRRGAWRPPGRVLVVAGILGFQLAYYTFVVGGDHFEFRIYAWVVPFVPVLLAAALAHTRWTVPVLYAWILLSWPIPWVHWWASQARTTRDDTHVMIEPIAARFPAILRPYAQLWDDEEAWLIPRHIGMRHQEHKIFHLWLLQHTPPRSVGAELAWEPDHPLRTDGSCGVIGWTLPNVAIIDTFGLSDPIIAHRPDTRKPGERKMAHERDAPPGYLDCFEPDVELPGRKYLVQPRKRPLTAQRILRCQRKYAPPEVLALLPPAGPPER